MVSILVPVYNSAPYLRQCLDSLIGQTYTDLQIVIINDGSTDDSWNILKEYSRLDKRIEAYSQPNCGVAATRNRLLDKVRGDFVLFVDSDDWIEPNTVEILLNEQQQGDYDIVMFQMLGAANAERRILQKNDIIKLFLEHKTIRGQLWNKLFKYQLFDGCYLDETVCYGEDSLLVWQALLRVNNLLIIEDQLYNYREHDGSISGQKFNGKKFTAYTVWKQISQDVSTSYPEYSNLARARFASEMSQVLLAAAKSKYKRNYSVKLLQEVIQQNGPSMKKSGISSLMMRFFTRLVSRHYWLVRAFGPVLLYYSEYRKKKKS